MTKRILLGALLGALAIGLYSAITYPVPTLHQPPVEAARTWDVEYQCISETGCLALMPVPGGATREIVFKKGDYISPSSGWIIDESKGWVRQQACGGTAATGEPSQGSMGLASAPPFRQAESHHR